jgi:hypothetical protein
MGIETNALRAVPSRDINLSNRALAQHRLK